MIDIIDTVKGWDNFTDISNAKKRLSEILKGDEVLIGHYLRLLNQIPYLTWESGVSKPDLEDGWDRLLPYFSPRAAETFNFRDYAVKEIEPGYPGLCHKASWELLKRTPGALYYSGFCSTDEDVNWCWHSFLVKDSTILESTGIIRDSYTGILVDNPEKLWDMDSFTLVAKDKKG